MVEHHLGRIYLKSNWKWNEIVNKSLEWNERQMNWKWIIIIFFLNAKLNGLNCHFVNVMAQILSQLDHFSEEELRKFNFTSFPEIECFFNFTNSHYPAAIDYNDETSGVEDKSHGFSAFCNSTWDGILCWPTTRARSTSILPCISRLNGIDYDIKRECQSINILSFYNDN